jgi:hypothetical protein
MRRAALVTVILSFVSLPVFSAELRVPSQVKAGSAVTIGTSGSGEGTLIVAGPAGASKQKVNLGGEITLNGHDVQKAGRYIVVMKGPDGTESANFFVVSGAPDGLAFLAQPSRVPAAHHDVISGTAFVMDKYHNLVIAPTSVKFSLAEKDARPDTHTVVSNDGIAWVRLDSERRAGPAQFVASVGDLSVKRIVQQVAADPCNLRIHAIRAKDGILVQSDPIRDCSGNPVPDGTIVTITQYDDTGKSTVDARIKKGIATAELPPAKKARISVASGVVVGNEITWRGGE